MKDVSELVDMELKARVLESRIGFLEKQNKEILFVLERNQVVLEALYNELQQSKKVDMDRSGVYV